MIVQHAGLDNVAGWLCQTGDGCCTVFQRSVKVPVLTVGWAVGCFASPKDASPGCTQVGVLGSTGKAPRTAAAALVLRMNIGLESRRSAPV